MVKNNPAECAKASWRADRICRPLRRARTPQRRCGFNLLVVEKALETPEIAAALVAPFNDQDENNTQTLTKEIARLPDIDRLTHKPIVRQNTVGEDAESYFNLTRDVPTFTFLDPFGYKGLSLQLVNGVIKNWGCDCAFFFNYNRINAGLTNPKVKDHMDALFGEGRADKLRAKVAGAKPRQREEMVLEAMSEALRDMGGEFALPFHSVSETRKVG